MRELKVTSGPAAGQTLEVDHEVVIGREGADLTIADEEISRRHAMVRPVENGIVVEDLGSLNGTFVNGERISEAVTITLGSTLRVGASDIEIELELLAPTKVRDIVPSGQPTVARDVPAPEPPPEAAPAAPPAEAAPEPVAKAAPQPAAEQAPETEAKAPPGGPRGPAPPPRYGSTPSDSATSGVPTAALIAGAVLVIVVVVLVVAFLL